MRDAGGYHLEIVGFQDVEVDYEVEFRAVVGSHDIALAGPVRRGMNETLEVRLDLPNAVRRAHRRGDALSQLLVRVFAVDATTGEVIDARVAEEMKLQLPGGRFGQPVVWTRAEAHRRAPGGIVGASRRQADPGEDLTDNIPANPEEG